jgi:hypothetical protein
MNFPTDFDLPPFLRDYLAIHTPTTKTSRTFLITALLPHMAAYLGPRHHVGAFDIRPCLWSLLIGPSTKSGKTTALSRAARATRAMQRHADGLASERHKRWDQDNKDKKAADRDPPPEAAPLLDFDTDFTPEKLVADLAYNEATETGAVMTHGEFGGFLAAAAKKYNAGLVQRLTDIKGGDRVSVGRQTGGSDGGARRTTANRPYLCLAVATNADWLRDALRESDITSGFLSRFLIVEARGSNGLRDPFPPSPDPVALSEWEAFCWRLRSEQPDGGRWTLCLPAKEAYAEWFYRWEAFVQEGDERVTGAIARKQTEDVLALAMIFAKAAMVRGESPRGLTIDADSMAYALTLTEFYIQEAVGLVDTTLLTGETAIYEQKALEAIQCALRGFHNGNGNGDAPRAYLTKKEFTFATRHLFRRAESAKRLRDETLASLVEQDWIVMGDFPNKKTGRKETRIALCGQEI